MLSKIINNMTILPLVRKEKHSKLALPWTNINFFSLFSKKNLGKNPHVYPHRFYANLHSAYVITTGEDEDGQSLIDLSICHTNSSKLHALFWCHGEASKQGQIKAVNRILQQKPQQIVMSGFCPRLRIRITLMRIRILLLNKMMQICNHCLPFTNLPNQ